MPLRFRINEEKAIESLVWIASEWPNITPFYVAKILFFAEKDHMNRYARPIVADTFIAMPYGPVPSTVRDYIEGNYLFSDHADVITDSISVNTNTKYPEISARRAPNLEVFSPSDIECLSAALNKCRTQRFHDLSNETHLEPAWLEAPENGAMDYALFIDKNNPYRASIIEQAEEYARYGAA